MKNSGLIIALVIVVMLIVVMIHLIMFRENFENSHELKEIEDEIPLSGATYDDLDTEGDDTKCAKSRYVRNLGGYSRKHHGHVRTH